MSRKFIYSPSYLERLTENPIKTLYDSHYRGYSGISDGESVFAKSGTEVHEYVEKAFKYLNEKKPEVLSHIQNNGLNVNTIVANFLDESIVYANSSLKLKTSEMFKKGADRIIRRFGSEFLKSPDMQLMTEQELYSSINVDGKRIYIGGRPDLVFYDVKKKAAQIVDLKNISDSVKVNIYEKAGEKLQAKMYPYLLQQYFAKNHNLQFDNINFTFAMNAPTGSVVFSSIDYKKEMAELETELSITLARAESYKNVLRDAQKQFKSTSNVFLTTIDNLSAITQCKPGVACNSCMIRFACKYKLLDDVTNKYNYLIKGETENITELSPEEQNIKRMLSEAIEIDKRHINEISKQNLDKKFSDNLNKILEQERDQAYNLYKDRPYADGVYSLVDSISASKRLYESSKRVRDKLRERLDKEALKEKGFESKKRVPFSFLSHMNLLSSSDRLGHTAALLRSYAVEYVNRNLTNALVDNKNLATEIVDYTFAQQDFAEGFHKLVVDRVANQFKIANIEPDAHYFEYILRDIRNVINSETLRYTFNGLNENFVTFLKTYEKNKYDKLLNHLSPEIDEKVLRDFLDGHVMDSAVEEFTQKATERALFSSEFIDDRPLVYKREIRSNVSSVFKALALTVVASNQTIANIITNTIDKAKQFLFFNDKGIDTGEHYSQSAMYRRLISSDFGSEKRKFNPVSSRFSYVASRGSVGLNKAKEYASAINREINSNSFIRNIEILQSPLGKISLMTMLLSIGINAMVPRTPSPKEDMQLRNQRLKQRKERLEDSEVNLNTSGDSSMYTPSSKLRAAFKLHTQFGSPFNAAGDIYRILEKIPLSGVMDYIKGLLLNPIERMSSYWQNSKSVVFKKGLAVDISDFLSAAVTENEALVMRSKLKSITQEIVQNIESTVLDVEKSVTAHSRRNLLYTHSRKVDDIHTTKRLIKRESKRITDIPERYKYLKSKEVMPLPQNYQKPSRKVLHIINNDGINAQEFVPPVFTDNKKYDVFYLKDRLTNRSALNIEDLKPRLFRKGLTNSDNIDGLKLATTSSINSLDTMIIPQHIKTEGIQRDLIPEMNSIHIQSDLSSININLMRKSKVPSYGKMFTDYEGAVHKALNINRGNM